MKIEKIIAKTQNGLSGLENVIKLVAKNNDAVLMLHKAKIKTMINQAAKELSEVSAYLAPFKIEQENVIVELYTLSQRKKALLDMCIATANLALHSENTDSLNPLSMKELSILAEYIEQARRASKALITCKRGLGHENDELQIMAG